MMIMSRTKHIYIHKSFEKIQGILEKKITLQRTMISFSSLYSSVYKKHSDEANWKCIFARFHHSHLLPSKMRERCLYVHLSSRETKEKSKTKYYTSISKPIQCSIDEREKTNEDIWSKKWFSSTCFFSIIDILLE
jgi:hypothetical protein